MCEKYRYLWMVPPGSPGYPLGHYGCMTAVSMTDAIGALSRNWPAAEVYRVSASGRSGRRLDDADQEDRKLIFDAVAIITKSGRGK